MTTDLLFTINLFDISNKTVYVWKIGTLASSYGRTFPKPKWYQNTPPTVKKTYLRFVWTRSRYIMTKFA